MHTIEMATYREMTFGERWAMTVIHIILSIIKPDERISVLMTMLGANLVQVVREDELDGVLDTMRQQVKMEMREMRL